MQQTLFANEPQDGQGSACAPAPGLRHPWWKDEGRVEHAANGDLFSDHAAAPVERFGSGASALFDFLGYCLVNHPVGVTATEMGTKVLDKIVTYLDRGGRVFVDSGAFGAHNAGRVIDFEQEVFPHYDYLVERTTRPAGLMLVMPDVVGDQRATLQLQRTHLPRIIGWIESGVEAVFPVQNPDSDPVGVYREIRALIGDRPHTVGVPSNKHAWSASQVVSFAAAVKPARMHLLGLAREGILRQLARDIAAVSPLTRLSCDSCQVIAHAGAGRRLTDRTRSRLEDAVRCVELGEDPDVPLPDLSSYVADVLYTESFLTAAQAVMLGGQLGYAGEEWAGKFAAAVPTGMADVLGPLDPDEQWMPDALRDAVAKALYRPWLRKVLAGPIRAWEVARLACGVDPEWHRGGGIEACDTPPCDAAANAASQETGDLVAA